MMWWAGWLFERRVTFYRYRAVTNCQVRSTKMFGVAVIFLVRSLVFAFLLSTMLLNRNPSASGDPSTDRSTDARPPNNVPPEGFQVFSSRNRIHCRLRHQYQYQS
jgi:hypothetical protein